MIKKCLIMLIFILLFFMYKFVCSEHFFDFKNIPENYSKSIDDIYKNKYDGIPKIIHHICPRDFKRWNLKWFVGYESWIRLFPQPEYTHMHWYDDELDKFIESDFPWFLEVFNSYDKNIKRIDMVRPFFLYKYGGIYADMDYVVFKNFYDLMPPNKVSIPESPYKHNEFIQNALLISPKEHNFWLLIIDECYNHRNDHVFDATGPQLYTKTYYKYKDLINVLPIDLYNPDINDKDAFEAKNIYTKHLLSSVWTHQ